MNHGTNQLIIDVVSVGRDVLYELMHTQHPNHKIKLEAWVDIGKSLGLTIEECLIIWNEKQAKIKHSIQNQEKGDEMNSYGKSFKFQKEDKTAKDINNKTEFSTIIEEPEVILKDNKFRREFKTLFDETDTDITNAVLPTIIEEPEGIFEETVNSPTGKEANTADTQIEDNKYKKMVSSESEYQQATFENKTNKKLKKRNKKKSLKQLMRDVVENIQDNKSYISKRENEVSDLTIFTDAMNTQFLKWPKSSQNRFMERLKHNFCEEEVYLSDLNLI